MKNEYVPCFRTKDFEEALILASAGVILSDVEWDYQGEVGTFVFEDNSAAKVILDKHKRKGLQLASHDLLFAYREIKNLLFRRR